MNESESALSFKEAVKALIDRNIKTYEINPDRIISDYRGEKEFTEAYIGRQLLELLQNADDAKTDKVLISLDIEDTTLSVANNGLPFDLSGVKSLMLAYNSKKNKKEFIGNKGLGFRSILNWVTWVKIKTRNFILEFSPEIAKREFELLISDSENRQKLIKNEKELQKGEVPFAILAIPDFKENMGHQDWETIIELKYTKKSELAILEQIQSVTPEVLLFLNHTKEIEILGTAGLDKKLILEKHDEGEDHFLSVNHNKWQIDDSGDISLPDNQEKFFRYKIAWQENLSDKDSRFFTFFRTEVATYLPCLIHATFDLDPSRNYLNKTGDNKYILSEIAKAIARLASEKIKRNGNADWKAYQFLVIEGKSDNTLLSPFFSAIDDYKNTLDIYPCVDGFYRTKKEVKYFGNEFSDWVIRHEVEIFCPDLLIPIKEDMFLDKNIFISKYTSVEWLELIGNINDKIRFIEDRVELITILLSNEFTDIHNKITLPLLLDQNGKVVTVETQVFTLKVGSIDEYQLPSFVEISFIHRDLYDALTDILSDKIEAIRIANEDKSRPLKRLLSPILNIGSNDITDVVRNMTSAINSLLPGQNLDLKGFIIPFVRSLFEIFKRNPDRKGILDEGIPIQLINRKGELIRSRDLFLGNEFPTGVITELLFDGIYDDTNYIKGNDFWELPTESSKENQIENFFFWLGVNKYSRIKNIKKELRNWEEDEYTKFIFSKVDRPKFKIYKNYDVSSLFHLEEIINSKSFSLEKLVAWIVIDNFIFSQLNDDFNQDTFSYEYNRNYISVNIKPSYIKYQLLKDSLFDNIVLDFEFAGQLGLKSFDVDNELFKKLNLDKAKTDHVLRVLGVKMSFNDLEADIVYAILKKCWENNFSESHARKLYMLAFINLQQSTLKDFGTQNREYKLLASHNGNKDYRSLEEVYYSDNSTLPSKIVEQFWIFDFPKRRGERQISQYFGVKTFKDVSIKIYPQTAKNQHARYDEFNTWVEKIKPFILTYRLYSFKKDRSSPGSKISSKSIVSNLKKLSIKLVSSLSYSVNDGEIENLLPCEFLNENSYSFYLCADPTYNLEKLKDTPVFCEAFSEILSVLFEVNENRDDYRAIFKDKPELRDTKYLIRVKSLDDTFNEACSMLGLSVKESSFWTELFSYKKLQFPDNISSIEKLHVIVGEKLNYVLPDNYNLVNFDSFDNQESSDFLKSICLHQDITLQKIKMFYTGFHGLTDWHQFKFNQASHYVEQLWNKALWVSLSMKSEPYQRQFEGKRMMYNQKIYSIILTLSEQNSLVTELAYEDILIVRVSNDLEIPVIKEDLIEIEIANHYKEKLLEYNISLTDLPEEIQSLFYFPGHEEVIGTELLKYANIEIENAGEKDYSKEVEKIDLITITLKSGNIPISKEEGSGIHPRGWISTSKSERQKKKAGKQAEKLVKEKLNSIYPEGEVVWLSGNSDENSVKHDDSKGYDLLYKKNKNDLVWFCLEVKSISSDSFIISANEVNVGINERERYHLALVEGLKIFLVEDFFLNEERVVEFNSLRNSSSIRPLDYEVYFKLPALNVE